MNDDPSSYFNNDDVFSSQKRARAQRRIKLKNAD